MYGAAISCTCHCLLLQHYRRVTRRRRLLSCLCFLKLLRTLPDRGREEGVCSGSSASWRKNTGRGARQGRGEDPSGCRQDPGGWRQDPGDGWAVWHDARRS
jgi:hypothetical protein